jgi:drug/metabolite transporter (DMT)-like permease
MVDNTKSGAAGRRPFLVYPLLAAGLTSFAFSPILIRFATDVPPLSLAVWRTVFSVFMLAPFAIRSIGEEVRRFRGRDVRLILVAGVLLAFHFVAWISSLYHTSVASASVLVSLSPIFLAVLGLVVLRERLARRTVVAIVLAVAGSILIGIGDRGSVGPIGGNPLLGNAMATGAAFFVSCYLLVGRVMRQHASWLAYVFSMYTVVAVVILAIALVSGVPLLGFDARIYILCALMALGPQIVGHGSFNYALKYFPAALLGLLSLTEPIGGSVLAYFFFDELPSVPGFIGMIIVLLSVVGALLPRRNGSSSLAAADSEVLGG